MERPNHLNDKRYISSMVSSSRRVHQWFNPIIRITSNHWGVKCLVKDGAGTKQWTWWEILLSDEIYDTCKYQAECLYMMLENIKNTEPRVPYMFSLFLVYKHIL